VKEKIKEERFLVILLAAIQFAHIVDFVVIMPLGPFLIEKLNISPAQFGSLVSSYNYAGAVGGILFGIIADRFGKKAMLSSVMLGFIIGTTLCGLASDYQTLFAARVFTGAFGGILNALILAIIADLIPFERRGKALGTVMSSFSIASVFGIPIGLLIADHFGWQSTFLFISTFSFLILIAVLKILPSLTDHIQKTDPLKILKRYFNICTNRDYFKAYSLIFTVSFTMFLLIPFLAPYAVKNIGMATTDMKYMYFFGGCATVITARLFGKLTDLHGAHKMYTILALLSLLPVYLYTNSGPLTLVGYILMGTLFMTIVTGRMVPCMTLISSVPNQRDRGSFMLILNSTRAIGSATSTLLGGIIIQEKSNKLFHFEKAGYLSMALVLLSLILAKFINASKHKVEKSEPDIL